MKVWEEREVLTILQIAVISNSSRQNLKIWYISFSVSTSRSTTVSASSYQPVSEKTAVTFFPSSAYSRSSNVQYSIPTSSRKPPSLKPPTRSSTSIVSSSR